MTFATSTHTQTRYGYSFLSKLPRWLVWEYALDLGLNYCYLCGHALLQDEWVLEHDHLTDEVRGLAHYACNTAAGHMEGLRSLDDPESEFRSTYYRVKGVNKLFHQPASTEGDTAAYGNWKVFRDVLGDDDARGFLARRISQRALMTSLSVPCDQAACGLPDSASEEERNLRDIACFDDTSCLHTGEVFILSGGTQVEVYTRELRETEAFDPESEAVVRLSCIKKGTDVFVFMAVNLDMGISYEIGWCPRQRFLTEGHEIAKGKIGLPYRKLYPLKELAGYQETTESVSEVVTHEQQLLSGDVGTNEQQDVN